MSCVCAGEFGLILITKGNPVWKGKKGVRETVRFMFWKTHSFMKDGLEKAMLCAEKQIRGAERWGDCGGIN